MAKVTSMRRLILSTSFISAGNFRYIDEDAFTNYLPASFGPFTNGVLVCGNAIAGVDTKAKELVIPPKVSMSGIKSQPDVTFKKNNHYKRNKYGGNLQIQCRSIICRL